MRIEENGYYTNQAKAFHIRIVSVLVLTKNCC